MADVQTTMNFGLRSALGGEQRQSKLLFGEYVWDVPLYYHERKIWGMGGFIARSWPSLAFGAPPQALS